MVYFQYLSMILGAWVAFAGFWLLFSPNHYRNLAKAMVTEKRPTWFLPISAVWLVLIALTWLKYVQFQTVPTLIISLIISMTMIKIYAFTFQYEGFRNFAMNFLNCPDDVMRVFGLIYIALGGAFFALGLSL